eukprot:m.146585 g.146585  ORF g.146585 m.146585 type:complete len:91 (-) comp13236_c0_seq2:412-684(-)
MRILRWCLHLCLPFQHLFVARRTLFTLMINIMELRNTAAVREIHSGGESAKNGRTKYSPAMSVIMARDPGRVMRQLAHENRNARNSDIPA